MPELYIITGSNGAGKSSFGAAYLPAIIQANFQVFDGDKLFLEKRKELFSKFTPSLKEAKRQAGEWLIDHFNQQVQKALDNQTSFVYEGHFVAEETWDVPRRFQLAGYELHILFFGLEDTSLSQLRVLDRAIHGGHNVPPPEIELNFYGNLRKLNEHFDLPDYLTILDTSEAFTPKLLAKFKKGELVFSVRKEDLPEWFIKGLPNLFALIKA